MEKFVIVNDKDGIYVGYAMGFGFWSKLERAGQESVPVFETEADAREHVASWLQGNNPDDYTFEAVEVAFESEHATVKDLFEAGLGSHLGQLEEVLERDASKTWDRLDNGTYWHPLAPVDADEYISGETAALFITRDAGSWWLGKGAGEAAASYQSLVQAKTAVDAVIARGYDEMAARITRDLGVDGERWHVALENGIISVVSREDPRWATEFDADAPDGEETSIETTEDFTTALRIAEARLEGSRATLPHP